MMSSHFGMSYIATRTAQGRLDAVHRPQHSSIAPSTSRAATVPSRFNDDARTVRRMTLVIAMMAIIVGTVCWLTA